MRTIQPVVATHSTSGRSTLPGGRTIGAGPVLGVVTCTLVGAGDGNSEQIDSGMLPVAFLILASGELDRVVDDEGRRNEL